MAETERLELLLKKIRESFAGAATVFKRGSCFQLYEIVKVVFPDVRPYLYNEDHIYIDLHGSFFDINGEVNDSMDIEMISRHGYYLDQENYLRPTNLEVAQSWKFNMFMLVSECPYCEEEFHYAESMQGKHLAAAE